jgi:PAT family beta-lactamase induction signal transducer AmpG
MAGPAGIIADKVGWFWFWGFTVIAAIPGMILLWILWNKGYVAQGIRQTEAVDEGKLREPIGAVRIFGVAVAVAGLVGLLLSQPLRWPNYATWTSAAIMLAGGLVAWLGRAKPSPEASS